VASRVVLSSTELIICLWASRDSDVDIVTFYGLHGQRVGVRIPVGLYVVQTGSGAYLAFYPVSTVGPFSGSKVAKT
jgi:hypothetical protein